MKKPHSLISPSAIVFLVLVWLASFTESTQMCVSLQAIASSGRGWHVSMTWIKSPNRKEAQCGVSSVYMMLLCNVCVYVCAPVCVCVCL